MKKLLLLIFCLLFVAAGCSSRSETEQAGEEPPTASGSAGTNTTLSGSDADESTGSGTDGTGTTGGLSGSTDTDRGDPRTGTTTPEGEPREDVIQTDKEANKDTGDAADPQLRAAVEKALRDQNIDLTNIRVDADNGIVTLSGTAASQQELDQILNTVGGLADVKSVSNQLTVE